MKIIKLVLTFILLFSIKSAFPQWTTYYTGSGTQHWDCSFINPNTGWAGGDGLKVFKTTNSGNNWLLIHSPSNSNIIYSIFFADSIHGWAGTYTGELYRTTNGGYNWNSVAVASNKKIYSVYFINKNTGWYTGESGIFGKTTNGGVSWLTPGALFAPADAFTINFRDSVNGYACGFEKLAKTTNGGSTWDILSFYNVRLSAISFINMQTGYVSGSLQNITLYAAGPYILKTTNGGINWNNIYTETPIANNILMVNESHFHNENTGLYAGTMIVAGPSYSYYGVMRKTTNGGLNWSGVYLNWNSGLESIKFTNSLTGFATGAGAIYKTTNGGLTYINNSENSIPVAYSLSQNYPNPFNPMCNVQFSMCKAGNVKLVVYDLMGREVKTLVNERLNAGTYETTFDGSKLSSGVYYYKLISDNYTYTKKMVLLK